MYTVFSRGAAPIVIAAAVSIAVLLAALGAYVGRHMQPTPETTARDLAPAEARSYVELVDADQNGIPDWRDELAIAGVAFATSTETASSTPSDPVSSLGTLVFDAIASGYVALKQYDEYTPSRGEQLAETIAANLRAPNTFTPHTTDSLIIEEGEASLTRILQYRADMRLAVIPMIDWNAEPEFALFGRYIATGETVWLDKLGAIAEQYRKVESNMLNITIPASAGEVHLRALNAIAKYAETLERLIRFADDPIATAALLRTYNEDEREFFLAFDALAKYYVARVEE